ncbi:MAG TPA: hypothetical protein VLE94_20145 [Burkholderiaceae bacterium]|nr:hypothetical protein [Burkholderiaceae bacterium]
MRYLSSSATFIPKYVFPVAWVAGMAYVAVAALVDGHPGGAASAALVAVVVLVFRHFFASDLADQVVDLGDHLVVKRGLQTERVPLASIVEVTESVGINPAAIIIRLSKPSKFGRLISFTPTTSSRFNPVAEHSLVSELRERSLTARAKSAG